MNENSKKKSNCKSAKIAPQEIPMPVSKCKVDLSNTFFTKICDTAKQLGVSKQGLIVFLIMNRYDEFIPDIYAGNYEKIKKALQMHTGATRESEIEPIEFRVSPIVNNMLKDLAHHLKMSKKELIKRMLYNNDLFFDNIIDEIHHQKELCENYKVFRKDKITIKNPIDAQKNIFQWYATLKLSCMGIKLSDFSKLSTAYCLYHIFSNLNDDIWAQIFEGTGLI